MVHVRTWGTGSRTALLLHGSTSSSNTWWKVAPAMAERGWHVSAFDLPGHGQSPAPGTALVPSIAAEAVAKTLGCRSADLLVGHSFGAAVAMHLCATNPGLAQRLVLEELPGGLSVDWTAEANAAIQGAATARSEPEAAYESTRTAQPRWADTGAQNAITDLARCAGRDVADGLREGQHWTTSATMSKIAVPTTLLLAPDQPGVNRLEDATALRGLDRAAAIEELHGRVLIIDAGHCIHRDDPAAWLEAVTATTV